VRAGSGSSTARARSDAAVARALAVQGATIEHPGSVYDYRGTIAV
jgi:hypothetical protein